MINKHGRWLFGIICLTGFVCLTLSGCKQLDFLIATPTPLPTLTSTATSTASLTPSYTPTHTFTHTPTSTITFTPSMTPTITNTATITQTPTITKTATFTPSPTFDFPDGVVSVGQANCRYGPGKAYIYSHGLYEGDHVLVHGRNYSGTWLWVQPDNLNRHCWAAASVFDIDGDVMRVLEARINLPKSSFVSPPSGVAATRNENEVTISWDAADYIPEGDRRGYLLEVYVCQNEMYVWLAIQTNNTSIAIQDGPTCSQPSSGLLYIAEKHGYSDPVNIPWP